MSCACDLARARQEPTLTKDLDAAGQGPVQENKMETRFSEWSIKWEPGQLQN